MRGQQIPKRIRLSLTVIAACGLFSCAGLACLKLTHTYLICVEPDPERLTLNGKAQDMGSGDCFILNELYGEHIIDVQFRDNKRVTVAVYPRLSDDNSSSLTITKTKVVGHGDLRYRVISQRDSK